jgi:hypothetical protein
MTTMGWFRWLYRLQRQSGAGRIRALIVALDAFKPTPF